MKHWVALIFKGKIETIKLTLRFHSQETDFLLVTQYYIFMT